MLTLGNHILDRLHDHLRVHLLGTDQSHRLLLKIIDHLDLVQSLLEEKVILDHLLNLHHQK